MLIKKINKNLNLVYDLKQLFQILCLLSWKTTIETNKIEHRLLNINWFVDF